MANSKYLRWLKDEALSSKIAQRFVAFCEEDVEQRAQSSHFDASIYEDAMKLIINRLEHPEGDIETAAEAQTEAAQQEGGQA